MHKNQDRESLIGASMYNNDNGSADSNNRRQFLQTAVGVGFAAAALPISAQTMIKTDSSGLISGSSELDIAGQKIALYHAQPEGRSNPPVVLVISEIFGVHEHIADVARRFAKQGYLAIAPDLFVRQGDTTKYPSITELIKEVVGKVPDAQVMSDLDAVVAWAKTKGGDTNKLAITGFCWGGRITWLYAAHNPQVKVGAAWYGGLTGPKSDLRPIHPIDIAAQLQAPILGLYGAKDTGIPLTSIEQMQVALAQGKSHSEFKVYENSGHAFHADYRASYVAEDAQDAWTRCLAWFATHLK